MTVSLTVDEFVEKKVVPEYRDIVKDVRALIRTAVPDAQEAISYGIPMYRLNKVLAWINPSTSGVTVGFTYGKAFEDRFGLLRGSAKHSRHVRIRTPAELNRAALRYYLKQAAAYDRRQAEGPA
jgi:hypothetical protein